MSGGIRRLWLRTSVLLALLVIFMAGTANADTLVVPQSATEIGDMAFFGDYSIDEVILPEGLLRIGEQAFDRTSITEIRLPSSLESIADNCFDNTELMRIEAEYGTYAYTWAYEYVLAHENISLVTPHKFDDQNTIRAYQYRSMKIDVLVIGDNIKKIEDDAFRGATIRQLFIPESVEEIEWYAFQWCTIGRLEVIADSYAEERMQEIVSLSTNSEYEEMLCLQEREDGTYRITNKDYNTVGLTELTVPGVALDGKRISVIGTSSIQNYTDITSIVIEEGIEEIEEYNFVSCGYIKELHLPDSLRVIGSRCFQEIGENYEDEVVIDLPDGIVSLDSSVFDIPGMLKPKARYCFHKDSDTDKAFRNSGNGAYFTYYEHPDWEMRHPGSWIEGTYVCTNIQVVRYLGTSSHIYFLKIDHYPVAAASGNMCYDNDTVESVYYPEGYTAINAPCYCDNLKTVMLPSTLEQSCGTMWYNHDDLKVFIPEGSAVIDALKADVGRQRVYTYTFYPGLSASAEFTQDGIKAALTYTDCDLFSVEPWPVGNELTQQEETAIILSFIESVCESDSGKRITLTSLNLPNMCGEEIETHYIDEDGKVVTLNYQIDTMLIATGKIKGSLLGLTAGAASVVGTAWITYNGAQYVIAPSSTDSIIRSLGAMQTILAIDAAKALKEGATLNVNALDVFGKNGFISYLKRVFLEAGIDTSTLDTTSQIHSAIEAKSDEEFYENLKKLIEIAEGLS